MDVTKIITQYLREAKVMQLATVNGGQPWICTVNYAIDDAGNLYWLSLRTRRHSLELRGSAAAAVAIVKDPAVKQGLQLEGTATEVDLNDLERVHALYSERYSDKPERLEEARSTKHSAQTYYVFKPSRIQLHDEVNFPKNPQREITL